MMLIETKQQYFKMRAKNCDVFFKEAGLSESKTNIKQIISEPEFNSGSIVILLSI